MAAVNWVIRASEHFGLIGLNSRKIFERNLLSSDSVAKSATQKLGFSETVLQHFW